MKSVRAGVAVVALLLVAVVWAAPASAADPPSVSGVEPGRGPAAGGNEVVISGSDFTGASSVRFGPSAQASFTVDSDSQITAVAPAGTAGVLVNVWVTTPDGTSTNSSASWYYYVDPPVVSAVSPASGSQSSSTSVTITGENFNGATDVVFGRTPGQSPVSASSFTVVSDTQITATAPALGAQDSGEVTVVEGGAVSTPNMDATFAWTTGVAGYTGSSTGPKTAFIGDSITNGASADLHTEFDPDYYVSVTGRPGYRVRELQPYADDYVDGPGTQGIPDRVVINLGTNDLVQAKFATSPTIDLDTSADDLEAMVDEFKPATSCIVLVTVNRSAGLGDSGLAATINDRIEDLADASGGRIQIADWDAAITAHSGTPAWTTDTIHPNSTGRAVLIDLIADALDDCSPSAPSITSISPTAGPSSGGQTVTITGTGFNGATDVRFGPSTSAAEIVSLTDTQIEVVTPAYSPAGTLVNIRVDNPAGTSSTSTATQYYFQL